MNDHNLKITEAKASITDIVSNDIMNTHDLNESKEPSLNCRIKICDKDAPVVITKIDFDNDHIHPNDELKTIISQEDPYTKAKSKKCILSKTVH